MPLSAGRLPRSWVKASRPPADAPMPTMGKPSWEAGSAREGAAFALEEGWPAECLGLGFRRARSAPPPPACRSGGLPFLRPDLPLTKLPSRRRPKAGEDRKSTRLNSSHEWISYAVFCLKKKNKMFFRLQLQKSKYTGIINNINCIL